MKITQGPTMQSFADLFDVPVSEVFELISGYVNHPESMFPEQFKAGMIEETDTLRFKSIAGYIKSRIAGTADASIRSDLADMRMVEVLV